MRAALVGDAEDGAEDVDEPLLGVQAEQHSSGASDSRFVDVQLNVGRDRLRVWQLRVRSALKLAAVFLESPRFDPPAGALDVQQVVDRDAVQPSSKLALAPKRREVRDGLHEDLLRGILGILRVTDHPQRDVVDEALVSRDQRLQRFVAAGLREPGQLHVLSVGRRTFGEGVGMPHIRIRHAHRGTVTGLRRVLLQPRFEPEAWELLSVSEECLRSGSDVLVSF
jgi:hypothetical protein